MDLNVEVKVHGSKQIVVHVADTRSFELTRLKISKAAETKLGILVLRMQ